MTIGPTQFDPDTGRPTQWPLRRGDRVMHPDFRDQAPRLEQVEDECGISVRPAYQDPPIVGTVLARAPGVAHVSLPGVGVRILPVCELKRCEL